MEKLLDAFFFFRIISNAEEVYPNGPVVQIKSPIIAFILYMYILKIPKSTT